MVTNDDTDRPGQGSHLFMLRFWPEDIGNGQTDWRGKIQHVNSGEVRYFRDWGTLRGFVEALLLEEKEIDTRGVEDTASRRQQET